MLLFTELVYMHSAATTSFKVIRKHLRPFLGVHFDGTSEDVQIERLNLLTPEFQLDTRHKQGYNMVAWHVAADARCNQQVFL